MKHFIGLLFLLSLAAFCATGCHKDAGTAADSHTPTAPGQKEPETPESPPSADVLALARGDNEFAFDLYARLAKKDGNLVFSPYSISSALAMTYAGARGDTAAEMEKTLHFSLKPERLHPAFGDLSGRLMRSGNRDGEQLLVANSLWGQRGYPIRDDFLGLTRDDYGAEMQEVDFQRDTEGARQTINRWVEQKTKDMIQELLKSDNLNKDSKLVLVNAIYFHSIWKLPFSAGQTKKEPFHASAGTSVQVPMMHLTAGFQYYEGDGVQVLELPYQGNRLSMVVILPKAADGLTEVENDLRRERVAGWLAKLKGCEVTTTLPKFTMTGNFGLGQELKAMGMPLAFKDASEGQPRADFSEISDKALGKDACLHISEVVHEARVEVTEEGTKAGAATAVVMAKIESLHLPPPRAVFKADHPFIFLIRDRDTGSMLFLGRIVRASA